MQSGAFPLTSYLLFAQSGHLAPRFVDLLRPHTTPVVFSRPMASSPSLQPLVSSGTDSRPRLRSVLPEKFGPAHACSTPKVHSMSSGFLGLMKPKQLEVFNVEGASSFALSTPSSDRFQILLWILSG
jgi:hypothetical protein